MLLLGGMANVLQPDSVVGSFATILTKPERQYTDTQRTVLGQICIHLFQIGTLGMAYYLFCFRSGDFTLARYGVILLMVAMIYGLKLLIMLLVSYTFQLQKRCASITVHYENLLCVFCCALYPLLLVMQSGGTTVMLRTLVIILAGAYVLLLAFKYCRAYLQSPMALINILLFTLTLDVLPLLVGYYGTEYILSQSLVQL